MSASGELIFNIFSTLAQFEGRLIQERFLRTVERTASSSDQALALLLFYTGIRIGECVALDVDDLLLSARRSQVIVRSGKGDSYREIPLNRCRTTRHFFRAH